MSTGVNDHHGYDEEPMRKGSVSLMQSNTKQPSKSSLSRKLDADEENWAQVAQFNQLLD